MNPFFTIFRALGHGRCVEAVFRRHLARKVRAVFDSWDANPRSFTLRDKPRRIVVDHRLLRCAIAHPERAFSYKRSPFINNAPCLFSLGMVALSTDCPCAECQE